MSLYRSRDDKILLGICGGLGDKYDSMGATTFRAIFVGMFFLTAGAIIIPYLLGVILPVKSDEGGSRKDTGQESGEDYLMIAEGNNGQVELYENKIRITRKGILAKIAHGLKGSKEIPLENITSIQLKEAGALTAGFIQFGQSGYSESDGGLFSAAQDENSVNYNSDTEKFRSLKEKIYELKEDEETESTSNSDTALESLKKKYVEGEISEEEFEKKKELLED